MLNLDVIEATQYSLSDNDEESNLQFQCALPKLKLSFNRDSGPSAIRHPRVLTPFPLPSILILLFSVTIPTPPDHSNLETLDI